jgi:hypothetical protein
MSVLKVLELNPESRAKEITDTVFLPDHSKPFSVRRAQKEWRSVAHKLLYPGLAAYMVEKYFYWHDVDYAQGIRDPALHLLAGKFMVRSLIFF